MTFAQQLPQVLGQKTAPVPTDSWPRPICPPASLDGHQPERFARLLSRTRLTDLESIRDAIIVSLRDQLSHANASYNRRPNNLTGARLSQRTFCRGSAPSSLLDSPVPNKKPRKTSARHQDLALESIRADNVEHFPEWTAPNQQMPEMFEIPFVH
ncbi:hypothetical protein EVAR_97525_1 [Eumeta japonica]|uniref:Uncharacterized protein n=1 Tax=Eumeta variegata TaxID=151549 RepID=A0A4C1WPK3_EUMVA|nr:hypothetical protein EVAR_97525_1 [Eumeta japonica]